MTALSRQSLILMKKGKSIRRGRNMNLDIVMLTVLRENGLKIAIAADSASKHLGMDRGGEVIRDDES